MILSQIFRENDGFDKDMSEKLTRPQGRPGTARSCVGLVNYNTSYNQVAESLILSTDCPKETMFYHGKMTTRV